MPGILRVDEARLQVFWGWDFKNTLKNHLKQFNSSVDSWETAVADRPLWLAALGNRMALLKRKQFILSSAQRQTCRTEVLKVSVQPTLSNYVLRKILHMGGNWIQKFLGECFLEQEHSLAPFRVWLGWLRSKPWGNEATTESHWRQHSLSESRKCSVSTCTTWKWAPPEGWDA